MTVSTIQGFNPGDDLRWLARYMDEPFYEESEFRSKPSMARRSESSQYLESSNSNSVTGQNLHNDDGSVIFAPWNFGIGHV